MVAPGDGTALQLLPAHGGKGGVSLARPPSGRSCQPQLEHLVEVAVVEAAIRGHREGVAAHQAAEGAGIKGFGELLQVGGDLALVV